jgi:hypothetical protein
VADLDLREGDEEEVGVIIFWVGLGLVLIIWFVIWLSSDYIYDHVMAYLERRRRGRHWFH